MKCGVLLFEGRARQSLPLARAFKKLGCEVSALCASKWDVSYVSRWVDHKILGVCDNRDAPGTAAQIRQLVESGKYGLVVPTTDFSAMLLSRHKQEYAPFCKMAVNDWDVHQIAADKNKTMRVCADLGLPCPITLFGIENVNQVEGLRYPIVVKPKTGYGAIGFKRVDSKTDLQKMFASAPSREVGKCVFQEFIPQTNLQYECAMFIDGDNQVKTALVFSKNRWFPIEGGSSTLNITVDRPDIVESCTRLLQAINWRGPADIDLIQDPRDDTAKIMEINPRVSGSVKIAFVAGVDQARQMLELAFGEPVTEYMRYKIGQRLRCSQTDLLWFLKSPERFRSKPSWFSPFHTVDQVFAWDDPLPWFAFSIQGFFRLGKEMEKRSSHA